MTGNRFNGSAGLEYVSIRFIFFGLTGSEGNSDSYIFSAAAAGIPASAKIHVKYQSSSDFGAILVTHGSIQHDGLYYENMFVEWVTENAPKLLSSKKYKADIEKYGLVVVTNTYSCSKCALNAWHNS